MFGGFNHYLTSPKFSRALPCIIVFVSALNVIMVGGKRRSFGIFIASLHESYNTTSMAELNWIGDSYAALAFFSMPFVTTIILKFNRIYQKAMFFAGMIVFLSCMSSSMVPTPGYMFITHTILHGIGSSLILCTTALVTGEYFDKKHRFHVLATAFVSGGPYGVLIYGPMYASLVQNDGWRIAFRIVAIPFLIYCLLGAIFFVPKNFEYESLDGSATVPTKSRGWAFCSLNHIKENKQIFFWMLDRVLNNIAMYGLMMNLTAFLADDLKKSGQNAFLLSYAMGIGESIIFTIGAIVGDRLRGFMPFIQLVGAFLGTISLYAVYYNLKRLYVLTFLIGITGMPIGIANTALYATTEEVCLLHGSIAYPMTKMFGGVGMLLAPIFSGLAIDRLGYLGFFALMGIMLFIRTILLIIINIILMHKRQQKIKELVSEQVEMHQKAAKTDWHDVGDDGFPPAEIPVTEYGYYQPSDTNNKVL